MLSRGRCSMNYVLFSSIHSYCAIDTESDPAVYFPNNPFNMKYWILLSFALVLFACQSPTSTPPVPEIAAMDTLNEEPAAENSNTDLTAEEIEKIQEMQSEQGDDPNDFYARIPEEKEEQELNALEKARQISESAQMDFFATLRLKEWMSVLEEKVDEDGMPVMEILPQNQFAQLTVKEHLYYHLAYPEEWSQNCAEMYFTPGRVKAISRYLPFADDGLYVSERQGKYLEANRDSVSYWVKAFLKDRKAVTTPMLNLITDLKLKSAIPDLARIYRNQTPKDDLILTALIQMMDLAEYPGWTQSKLVKEDWDEELDVLELSQVNADMVLMYAEKYANGK